MPDNIYNEIISGKTIINHKYLFFNRLLLIKPLNYIDLIHLQKTSFFIMTDSGGIQEESISIGKPVLILRENTERPEGILSGSAILTGTSSHEIYFMLHYFCGIEYYILRWQSLTMYMVMEIQVRLLLILLNVSLKKN